MIVAVTKTDLSKYETFRIAGPNSNHITIAVRGTAHEASDISREHYSIHLLIWGDFGPWEHFWSHAGGEGETWWNWLHDTNMDYFLNKVTKSNHTEFDFEKSQAHALSEIIRMRREEGVCKNDAREAYDAIKRLESGSRDIFIEEVVKLSYTPTGKFRAYAMFEEYWGMTYDRTKPRLIWFWDNIWRPFIEQAKRTQGFTFPDPGTST